MFPHRTIHKTSNQTDHILMDGDGIRVSFGGADCDTDHYLVVGKVREGWAVSKQAALKFDVEKFNLRKLRELEVKKQYQTSNRFAALDN